MDGVMIVTKYRMDGCFDALMEGCSEVSDASMLGMAF